MTMTKGEREDLLRLVRGRERVLKSAAEQRSREMLAEFERQIARQYKFDTDEVWKAATESATAAIAAAQKTISERSKELGIPDEFAPRLAAGSIWLERGENALKQRREELRRVAKAEIAAVEHQARVEIERMAIEAQTEIIAHGLSSQASRAFLEALPTIEKLMPTLTFATIENRVLKREQRTLQ